MTDNNHDQITQKKIFVISKKNDIFVKKTEWRKHLTQKRKKEILGLEKGAKAQLQCWICLEET